MKLNKLQQDILTNLEDILRQQGRAYMLGWCLGMLIQQAQTDPRLRLLIERKSRDH